MVANSHPHETADLTEMDADSAWVIVAAKEQSSLEHIIIIILIAFIQYSNDFQVVSFNIFVANQLAIAKQIAQSLDGQMMAVAKVVLVRPKDLNVNLDDLFIPMILLVEFDANRERLAQQIVF